MLLLLVSLFLGPASAESHVPTFVTNPAYSKAPFAGLERVYVDPVTTAAQVRPKAERPAGEAVKDAAVAGAVRFTNPLMQWGELSVNGTKIGTIGPFATCTLEGFAAGWYAVDVGVTTGLVRHFAVEVK